MAKFIPVSRTGHANSGWLRPQQYTYAAATEMMPLLADEIELALPTLPLAFVRQGDPSGTAGYQLVALLSPVAGRNLFVKPDGSWPIGHVPVQLRGYPFRLMTSAESGEQVVCFDQESGLMTEAGVAGSTPLFDGNGEPSSAFKGILVFLQQYERRRVLTQQAVDALAELNLIVPWKLAGKDQTGRPVKGALSVHKIDGEALQKLTAEPLFKLHQCGALALAYGQLLSVPRVQDFGKLAQMQQARTEAAPTVNLDALFGANSDIIKFKNV